MPEHNKSSAVGKDAMQEKTALEPCPFCGTPPPEDLADTLYPSGIYWRENEEVGRTYHSLRDRLETDSPCWVVRCNCGCSMDADSREEAIAQWNRRATRPS